MKRVTKDDMEIAVARFAGIQRNLVIPNLSHSFFAHECDVVSVSQAGYMTEYEIKTSLADLRREWGKQRWKWHRYYRDNPNPNRFTRDGFSDLIRQYIICVPDAIGDRALPLIPDDIGAGLFTFDERPYFPEAGLFISRKLAHPRINASARKLTLAEREHIGRLMAMRYWGQRRREAGIGYF